MADWEATLDAALALAPTHVSAYALTVESGTPLGQPGGGGERAAPDDDDQALKYEIADDRLGAVGLHWYEVSNWAAPGEECRHNLLYWQEGDYAAIGCAAHGHEGQPGGGGRRGWNVRTPERYIAAIAAGTSPEGGSETLDPDARADEALVLALRTSAGIKLPPVEADPGGVGACIDDLVDLGLLDRSGDRAVLTRRGRLLGNEVAARLLLARRLRARTEAGLGTRTLALGRIECQWSSTSARPRSSGPSWRSTSPRRSRWDRRRSRDRGASACRAQRCATT